MCGICGAAWTDDGRPLGEDDLGQMVARLAHRGPDDAGTRRDDHSALGFRRLSIVDLAGAHQPLSNEDGTVWTVFNGEIYNFPALRRRLEARGHALRSAGDTEVLVHLYEDEGENLFSHLRGMFALAIWDSARRTLLLGRDRLGQKPLVYTFDETNIIFASELKSLLAVPAVARRIDPSALDRYLTYGYVPHPRTILRGVHKLPPGHLAVWRDGKLRLSRYWEPDWDAEVEAEPREDADRLRALLDEAVAEQMVADVPIGAFLSGGVDSTIVAGLMQRHSGRPIRTFSIGFDDPAFDESAYANTAAAAIGAEHHSCILGAEAWEALPRLAEQLDEPFADSSALPTWYVSRFTREHVTVALTGDAGDELFGGYDRYRALAIAGALDRLPAGARRWVGGPLARAVPASPRAKTRLRRVRRLLEGVGTPPESRYLAWMSMFDEPARAALYSDDLLDGLDDDPAETLDRAWNAAPRRDPVTRAMIADILTYLPGDLLYKVDMMSMAHSLECRSPVLDHRVVELALAMPLRRKLRLRGGRSKLVLKEAFSDLLPTSIRNRPKMGFGVPLDRWFRGPLKGELRAVLLDPSTLARGLFRPGAVERLVDEHIGGLRDHAYKLWSLLMLELWQRRYLDVSP